MNEDPEAKDKSEQLLNRVLRDLPLRPAPVTLESRVFRKLERRAALPWWRRGFKSWPLVARAAFVAICSAIIGFTFLDGSWAAAGTRVLHEAGALSVSWTGPVVAVITSARELAALLLRAIPPIWLYGGIAAAAMLYAVLFGLGAAAYRTLYLQPPVVGERL
jgi:hypothetical protein